MMETTPKGAVGCLIEWLAGPGKKDHTRWAADLGPRFCIRFTGTAREDEQARQRISALLDDLKELARLAEMDWPRFKALGEKINEKLARYRYAPQLILDRVRELRGTKGIGFEDRWPATGSRFLWSTEPYKTAAPLQELRAVAVIERAVRDNQLHALRRCDQCSKWFIATKPWAKHCGSKDCRKAAKRAYQTSEAYRAKRRKNPR